MRRIQEPSCWWILSLMFLISPKHKDCHPGKSSPTRRAPTPPLGISFACITVKISPSLRVRACVCVFLPPPPHGSLQTPGSDLTIRGAFRLRRSKAFFFSTPQINRDLRRAARPSSSSSSSPLRQTGSQVPAPGFQVPGPRDIPPRLRPRRVRVSVRSLETAETDRH